MVVHIWVPSTWEVETEILHFEASLGYIDLVSKKTKLLKLP